MFGKESKKYLSFLCNFSKIFGPECMALLFCYKLVVVSTKLFHNLRVDIFTTDHHLTPPITAVMVKILWKSILK
jgi:hypothetical protein